MQYTPVPPPLIDLIASRDIFYLVSHVDPDGDCIGSSLALGEFLNRLGKKVEYFNEGPFGRREIMEFARFFHPGFTTEHKGEKDHAVAIVLDCSTLDRIGSLADDVADMTTAVIDHHSSGRDFGDVQFINPSCPSTSLLVQQLIESLGEKPTLKESEYIFFAFATDTGFFRHLGENTQASFQLVAKLVEAGASPRRMYEQISSGVSLKSRQHLGMLLNRVESRLNGRFLYTWENLEEIKRYGRTNRDSDSLYQQLMNVEGVEILLVLREEEPGKAAGSIRTRELIDAGKLAARFGGGGHARAAGFLSDLSVEETLNLVFPAIEELLSSN